MRKITYNLAIFMAVAMMAAVATAQPASFTDLGDIGPEGMYTFDTVGSELAGAPMGTTNGSGDTELGLFNGLGSLIASNDDFTGLFSQVSADLTAGEYYLAVGEFNTTFSNTDPFGATHDGFSVDGTAQLNINPGGISGSSSFVAGADVQWFRANVTSAVPEPATGAVVALCGLAIAIRRRRA